MSDYNNNQNTQNRPNDKKNKNKILSYIVLILLAFALFSLFSPKNSTVDNTNNKPAEQKPARKTEYAMGETYEKDVFNFTMSNPREEAASFGDKRYLIVDAEAVATKDVNLGITVDALTDDGEIIGDTIPIVKSNYKTFPLFEQIQAGQKIKGQVAFEISDGKKITKLRVKEDGKIINFNL